MWARGRDGVRSASCRGGGPDTGKVQEEGVLLTAAYHLGGWAARWGLRTSLAQGRPATAA
jgi:hypothetical protein